MTICPLCSAPINDTDLLPCGHAAINLIIRQGKILGCLQCSIDMSLGLILHMENQTRMEKLEAGHDCPATDRTK